MTWRRVLLVVGLVLVAVTGWRLVERMSEKSGRSGQRTPPVVSLAAVEVRDLEQSFEAVGSVESPHRVEISPKVSGRIDYLTVQGGDRVRKDQVLVRLDDADLVAQVNQREAAVAEARYRLAQARLTRGSTEASVASELGQQEAALATAQADLEQMRQSTLAQVGSAEAALGSARASLDNARARQARVQSLYDQAFTAAQDLDDARTATEVAQENLNAARENLRAAKAKARADLAASEARLKQARAALDFARANTVQGAAYGENLAALQAVVNAAEAGLQSARSRLQDTVLVCPLDGWVTARSVDPGNVVEPGTSILTVQASGDLWVTVPVPEEVRPRLEIGDPATVKLDSLPDKTLSGEIVLINAAADLQSRQFLMRVRVESDPRIRPGMYARVSVPLEQARKSLAVPRDAVREGPSVLVVDREDKVVRRSVKLGMSTADWQQILEGVKAGDRVITLSAVPLKDGQQVKPETEGGK